MEVEEKQPSGREEAGRLEAVLRMLEERVERLRRDASRLEDERESIMASLDAVHPQIADDAHGCERLDRLSERCHTVSVRVLTSRDKRQEDALQEVNRMIDALVVHSKSDPTAACEKCHSFIEACDDDTPVTQPAFAECAPDDRKRIHRRLQGLMSYFTAVDFTEIP